MGVRESGELLEQCLCVDESEEGVRCPSRHFELAVPEGRQNRVSTDAVGG